MKRGLSASRYDLGHAKLKSMGALAGIIGGAFFLCAGVAMLNDYKQFGTRTVNSIPRVFRFGTVETHRLVLGLAWAVGGLLGFLLGLGALVGYLPGPSQ
jgi:hypothetical protein